MLTRTYSCGGNPSRVGLLGVMPQETDERTRTRSLMLKRSEAHDHVRILPNLTHVTVSPAEKIQISFFTLVTATTVASLLTHAPPSWPGDMGYEGGWVSRAWENILFWMCKILDMTTLEIVSNRCRYHVPSSLQAQLPSKRVKEYFLHGRAESMQWFQTFSTRRLSIEILKSRPLSIPRLPAR